MNTVVILLCAGSGSRMRGKVSDKILTELQGRPIFEYSVLAFEEMKETSSYVVVYRDAGQRSHLQECFESITTKQVQWIRGGQERQESVFNALEAAPADTDFVMIHDCARPLVRPESLIEVHQAAVKDKSAVLAHRVIDTIKQMADNSSIQQARLQNLDRKNLWAMETPQAFSRKLILGCYRKLNEEGIQVTDDTAAVIHFDYPVTVVENHFPNPKITLPEDLALAELMLHQESQKDMLQP
jgi:2-C-methyl-D-erythritol 4-phosphate cytidylyltransferase